MGNKELSLSFRSEPNNNVLQAVAQAAGRYSFDVLSVYEDLGDQSPMYPLMTLAKHSPSARVGPACIAVPKYHSLEPIIGEISRLDSISPGKAYLGLAPGAWMEKLGLKTATVNQLREAAEVSRYLLEKRDDGYRGNYYQVESGFTVNYDTPKTRVPLLIGAFGEKMAALAGEI
ncbi:MAG: LLM class flavin-dependent oxidoreductase, partial [Candidatus Curtissbacteria bacterium]